ncbi:23S rRNA (guanosine(2251)-2'-O)-methyltransferase RlmB [Desulfatiferula olefinivorans]
MKKHGDRHGRKNQRPAGHEILYGINPVTEMFRAGRRTVYELFLAGDKSSERMAELEAAALAMAVPVTRLDGPSLARLAGNDAHQNVAARVSVYPFSEMTDLSAAGTHSQAPPFVLLLDSIEDPHNLGALARTALGAGVDAVFLPKDRAAQPTPSAVKASAGALEHVRLIQVTNLAGTIRDLKKEGFWVTGLDSSGEMALYEADFRGPTALVVGGEGRGVRELVGKQCDYLVSIPQKGPVNSLNASVAGALAMYEVVRQRR